MMRLFGSNKTLCHGVSRRDLLQIGGLGAFGLTLEGWLRLQSAQAAPTVAHSSRGKAKSCILLYLFGGASQLETFDPKPDALAEFRGELGSIPSSISGVRIGELLPRTAKILDLTTVVRSMQHDLPIHPVGYVLTGIPASDWSIPLGANARDPKHWPFVGSVIDYLDQQRAAKSAPEIPRNVALPFPISSRSKRTGPLAGPTDTFSERLTTRCGRSSMASRPRRPDRSTTFSTRTSASARTDDLQSAATHCRPMCPRTG